MPSPRLKTQARIALSSQIWTLASLGILQSPLGDRALIRLWPIGHCRSLKLLLKKPPVKIDQPMFDFVFIIFSAKGNFGKIIFSGEESVSHDLEKEKIMQPVGANNFLCML